MKFWTLFLSNLYLVFSVRQSYSSRCDKNTIAQPISTMTFQGNMSDHQSCQIYRMPTSNKSLVINFTWDGLYRPYFRPLMIVGYDPIYSFDNISELNEQRNYLDKLGFYLTLNTQTVKIASHENETEIYIMIYSEGSLQIQFGFGVSISLEQQVIQESIIDKQNLNICDERHLGANCQIDLVNVMVIQEQSYQLQVLPQSWLYIALDYQESEYSIKFYTQTNNKDLFGVVISREGSSKRNVSGILQQVSYQTDLKSVFNSKNIQEGDDNCNQIVVAIYNSLKKSVMVSINITQKQGQKPDTKLMNTIIIILIGIIAFVTSFLIIKFIRRISNIRSQLAIQQIINQMNLRKKKRNISEYLDEHLPGIKFELCSDKTFSTECFICLCDFDADDECRLLYCQHIFHKKCFDPWHKVNETCPSCRQLCDEQYLVQHKNTYNKLFTDMLERDGKKKPKQKHKQKLQTSIIVMDDYFSDNPSIQGCNYHFDFQVDFQDQDRTTRATLDFQDQSPLSIIDNQREDTCQDMEFLSVYNYYF